MLAPENGPLHVKSDGAKPPPAADRAARGLLLVILVVLGVVLVRVLQLQVSPEPRLLASAGQRTSRIAEDGVRGDIIDVRGRMVAGTRFGSRIFVDPTRFRPPPADDLFVLADALGTSPEELALRIIPRIEENERRGRQASEPDLSAGPPTPPKPLIEYVSLVGAVEDSLAAVIRGLGLPGVHLERCSVRETPGAPLLANLVGKVGIDHSGLTGVEEMLDRNPERAVRPTPGHVQYIRDAARKPLWVEPGGYLAPRRGRDARLSIDLEIQRIAQEELSKGVEAADAAGGRAMVVDPHTGDILAMVDIIRPVRGLVDYDWKTPIVQGPRYRTIRVTRDDSGNIVQRNRCVEDAYEPGSTFKAFMWSATTDLGLARPDEHVDAEGGTWYTAYGRKVEDVSGKGLITWQQVLVYSSNIGMSKVTRRMSDTQMRDAVLRYGFGGKTGVGLVGESVGRVTTAKAWGPYTQTSVAMGYEVLVTPAQMVRAFSAFCREGTAAGSVPDLRVLAGSSDGAASPGRRAISPRTAELARDAMKGVADNLDNLLTRREESFKPRYRLFGKSGTAQIPLGEPAKDLGIKKRPRQTKSYYPRQYNTSFIAGGPLESPRLVTLVVIDDPGPGLVNSNRYYGAMTAGPVVRQIMERSLAYLGAPASFPDAESDQAARRDSAGGQVASAPAR